MSQNNFVIQDVVTHVYREDDYRSPKIFRNTFRKIISKIWIFLILLLVSAGIGYVAVYLPDSIAQKAGSSDTMQGLPTDLQNLSDTQKQELMKRFQGQR